MKRAYTALALLSVLALLPNIAEAGKYGGGGGYVKGMSATTAWDFYEAPAPWGPWSLIYSHTWTPQGYYCPVVCPKFQTADKVYVVTAGDFQNWWDHYHLTIVPIVLG